MYTVLYLNGCGFSEEAINLLEIEGLDYEKIKFSENIENGEKKYIKELNKEYKVGKDKDNEKVFEKQMFKDFFGDDTTFPRIYKKEKLIGGYDELEKSLST